MNNHPSSAVLTLYVDDTIDLARREEIDNHLRSVCVPCENEINALRSLKVRFGRLPHHDAPTALLKALRRQYVPPAWKRIVEALSMPSHRWRPVAAFAVFAIAVGGWFAYQPNADDFVDMDSLMAAHARYQAESMVPSSDMVSSDFSAHLTSYFEEER